MPAPTNGLILFWNMETLSGAQMDDLSPTENNGTITGTADKAGQIGRSRGFDGVDDQVVAASTPATSASYTILAWLRPKVTGSNLPISMDAIGLNYFSHGISSANKFTHVLRETGFSRQITSANTYATGAFYHVAGRYNGDKVYLFVNGVTAASAASAGGTFTWNSFRIGQRVGGLNLFTGDIDELRVYSRPLSLSEISDVYNDMTQYPVAAPGKVDFGELSRPLRPFRRVNRWSTMRKSEFQDR